MALDPKATPKNGAFFLRLRANPPGTCARSAGQGKPGHEFQSGTLWWTSNFGEPHGYRSFYQLETHGGRRTRSSSCKGCEVGLSRGLLTANHFAVPPTSQPTRRKTKAKWRFDLIEKNMVNKYRESTPSACQMNMWKKVKGRVCVNRVHAAKYIHIPLCVPCICTHMMYI